MRFSVRIDQKASGVFAIAPTPFVSNGDIDFDSIDRLVDFYAKVGCTGITALGILGEAPKLDPDETLAVARRFIRRSPIPVVIGVSAPGLASIRSLTRRVMDEGAAGVMIAPPSALRTDEQIVSYFASTTEAIGPEVPWVLQDYPLTLTVVMTVNVISRIITANPSCVMVKHEDWPGLEKISALRKLQHEGTMRPVSILCGNGGMFLDFEMERGADGAMTGYAFPDMLVDFVRLSALGERGAAHDLFDAHLPLIRYEHQQGVGLAVRKYLLRRRGIIRDDAMRVPFTKMSPAAADEVEYLLSRVARHDTRASF